MPHTSDTSATPTRSVSEAQELSQVGSTVLRNAWDPNHLAILRTAIVAYDDRRRERVTKGDAAPSERMYTTHGVGTFAGLVHGRLVEPGLLPQMFQGSPFQALCEAYFNCDEFYASPNRLGFRIHYTSVSDRSFIPYHQDSYTQDVRTPRVLNCWMPLDPGAGIDAPGLEVVRNTCRPDFPRKDFGLRSENAAYDFITIDRDRIIEDYGDNFMAPEFEVGDGLVFTENVIHRTYVTPEMTKPRINFEFRVFPANSLPPGVTIADFGGSLIRVAWRWIPQL